MTDESKKVKQQIIVNCPNCNAAGRHYFRKTYTYGPDQFKSVVTRLACSKCLWKFSVTIEIDHPTAIWIEGE